MANIIISYNRQNEAIARTLADDIEALGHTVWFDQKLSGGQAWWDQILETVRDCDVFVFVLDPEALNSTACKREYGYAADLGKAILPVLVAEGVSINLLPPALSKIQFVDYRKQDRDAAFRLARALATVPPTEPLPDPLPPPPEAPISYLGSFTKKIETTSTLSYEEQSAMVVDLKRSLYEPETANDARTLLERLRKRRDLFAAIAEVIDESLASTRKESSAESESQVTQKVKKALAKTPMEAGREPPGTKITQPPTTQPAPTDTRPTTTLRDRLICSLCGVSFGIMIGVVAIETILYHSVIVVLLYGASAAIAGAISGTNRRLIVSAIVGAALMLFGTYLYTMKIAVVPFLIIISSVGSILGVILGVIFRKLKLWP